MSDLRKASAYQQVSYTSLDQVFVWSRLQLHASGIPWLGLGENQENQLVSEILQGNNPEFLNTQPTNGDCLQEEKEKPKP